MFLVAGGVWIMFYAWRTLQFGSIHVPDAGFLPFLAGAALTILGAIWFLMTLSAARPDGEGGEEKRRWLRPILALVLMLIYAWAIETVGYISSTLVFTAAWQQIIEREKWGKTIAVSVIGTAAMYALFVYFLKVPIPQELFLR
jgi:putative tricarboxylic transport membrane protein